MAIKRSFEYLYESGGPRGITAFGTVSRTKLAHIKVAVAGNECLWVGIETAVILWACSKQRQFRETA
jgi:hypothetical protein